MRGETLEFGGVVTAATTDPTTATAGAPVETVPDSATFARLFCEHSATVIRVLRRMGVADADLEDLAQEVFVVVYRRWGDFRGESSLKTWICGIAARKAMGHRRRRSVRDEIPAGEAPPARDEGCHDRGFERLEQRQVLVALLDRLDDNKREVFVLYELEDLTMKQVAAAVEAPLHTCYSRLHAARDLLRQHMYRLAAQEQ